MPELQLLNSKEHLHMGWKPTESFVFARQLAMVPVAITELATLLPVYPLALFRGSQGAALQLVALTGLRVGENLFVTPDGRWASTYVPMSVALYPFVLCPADGAGGAAGVAFVMSSGAWREQPQPGASEQRFFEPDSSPTPALQQKVDGLQKLRQGLQLTTVAATALEAHGLLERWPDAPPAAAEHETVGLFRVSEAALNALDGQALKALQQANALPLAYAQLLSLSRMTVLQRLAALHGREAAKAAPADPALVQRLFDAGQSDTIQFNW